MALNFKFIGWCHEDEHDKVWGVIYLEKPKNNWAGGEKCISFWGRRGKKLQTKICANDYDLEKLIRNKEDKKGYVEVDENKLDTVYPEFQKDLEKTAIWAMLRGGR